jgi:hypothetical protein
MCQLGDFCSVSNPVPFDPDERIFTLEDISLLFRRLRKQVARTALIGALIFFVPSLLRAPNYQITASFKEGVEKSGADSVVKDLLNGIGGAGQQPQAAAVMQSYQVLIPLVQREGLQFSVRRSNRLFRMLGRVRDNWRAQMGKPLTELEWFTFQNGRYEGTESCSFSLRFSDSTHFQLIDGAGKKLAKGVVGTPVDAGGVSFTLVQIPSKLNIGKYYILDCIPAISVADGLRDKIGINSHKINKAIYDLSLLHRDRKQGVKLLNGLMEEYRTFLKTDHDQIASEQIAYLEQRQKLINERIGHMLDEHANYLSSAVGTRGFIDLEQEVESYLRPHEELRAKGFMIDLELARLQKGEFFSSELEGNPFQTAMSEYENEVQGLQQQRDLLELSLASNSDGADWCMQSDQLAQVRDQRQEAESLLESIRQKQWELPPSFSWANKFATPVQRKDFSQYLVNQIRLLSVREKMLSERSSHFGGGCGEFEGIDLDTAKELFIKYNTSLDEAQGAMSHYSHLQEEIQRSDFEMSSLSSILTDRISTELIVKASGVVFQLKDEKYRSQKEGTRWEEEIALQKKLLGDHLDQLYRVAELNASLVRDKIISIQQVSLDCINRQISVLKERIGESVARRIESLKEERKLLEEKMKELRMLAGDLPERWKLENWLKIKTEMSGKVMHVMAELVESKTIGHHLHHVESKPLDFAMLPLLPRSPKLFTMASVGAILFSFSFFFFHLIRSLLNGFPINSKKLLALRLPFAGLLSSHCDGPNVEMLSGPDLETIREVILFLDKHPGKRIIGLVGGRGPDYSFALAQTLLRSGKKPLLIRCDFDRPISHSYRPGILQWIQGEVKEMPIEIIHGVDTVLSGGFTPYGLEALQSKRFAELLQTDGRVRLIWTSSPIETSISKAILNLSDLAIVTVAGEQTEQLTPFVHWAYHEGNNRLTFISTS